MNHSFAVEHAVKYGLVEAILLQNIGFWIAKNKANDKHLYPVNEGDPDGEKRTWTYNSIKAFESLFPYLGGKQIRYALQHLLDEKVLIRGNFNKTAYDRTTWYALFDENAFILPFAKTPNGFGEKANGNAKTPNGSTQKGEPIPDVITDSKTDPVNTNQSSSSTEKSGVSKKETIKDTSLSGLPDLTAEILDDPSRFNRSLQTKFATLRQDLCEYIPEKDDGRYNLLVRKMASAWTPEHVTKLIDQHLSAYPNQSPANQRLYLTITGLSKTANSYLAELETADDGRRTAALAVKLHKQMEKQEQERQAKAESEAKLREQRKAVESVWEMFVVSLQAIVPGLTAERFDWRYPGDFVQFANAVLKEPDQEELIRKFAEWYAVQPDFRISKNSVLNAYYESVYSRYNKYLTRSEPVLVGQ